MPIFSTLTLVQHISVKIAFLPIFIKVGQTVWLLNLRNGRMDMASNYRVSFTAYKMRAIKFIRNQLSKSKYSIPIIQTKRLYVVCFILVDVNIHTSWAKSRYTVYST